MSLPATLEGRALAHLALSGGALSRWVQRGDASEFSEEAPSVLSLSLSPLGWGSMLDAALPDGGLPRGAVVEVSSALGLARTTSFAVAACASAQRASRAWSEARAGAGARSWCAWVDPWSSLHAPGLREAGIELDRLLVMQPPVTALARVALRVAASGVFSVVVVDAVDPRSFSEAEGALRAHRAPRVFRSDLGEGAQPEGVRLDRWPTVVRRLALAVEGSETSLLLLTDLAAPRGLPLPVSMRIELDRRFESREGPDARGQPLGQPQGQPRGQPQGQPQGERISRSYLRVAKERHGRVSGPVAVSAERFASEAALRSDRQARG